MSFKKNSTSLGVVVLEKLFTQTQQSDAIMSADIKTPGAPEESVEYIGCELDTPPLPQYFTKKLSTKLSILVSWLIAPLKIIFWGIF